MESELISLATHIREHSDVAPFLLLVELNMQLGHQSGP